MSLYTEQLGDRVVDKPLCLAGGPRESYPIWTVFATPRIGSVKYAGDRQGRSGDSRLLIPSTLEDYKALQIATVSLISAQILVKWSFKQFDIHTNFPTGPSLSPPVDGIGISTKIQFGAAADDFRMDDTCI